MKQYKIKELYVHQILPSKSLKDDLLDNNL